MEGKQKDLKYPELRSAKIMREKLAASRSLYFSVVLLVAAILLFGSATSATKINWEYGEWDGDPDEYIEVNTTGNKVMQFTILDGGDTALVNSTNPGDDLYSFENNRTMFLNQSFSTNQGLNGFDSSDAILRVFREHTEGRNETIHGEVLRNFSTETVYTEVSSTNDGFDGDEGVRSNQNESIIRNNGSDSALLDEDDFVISGGLLNATHFWDNITYTDINENSMFDGGEEAIIQHSSSADSDRFVLEDTDTVLREGQAGLEDFAEKTRHLEGGNFTGSGAIIDGDSDSYLERNDDDVVKNGSARLDNLEDNYVSYFESAESPTSGFDGVGEPIYYDKPQDSDRVNVSDVRLGKVNVTSRNDSKTGNVDLNLSTMVKINKSRNDTSNNDLGQNLYDFSSVSGSSSARFWVYEYADNGASADGDWNPDEGPNTGDQDVLIYDLEGGDEITSGETLLYDEHTSNSNISIDVGEEFNGSGDSKTPSNSYSVSGELGFNDSDDDGVYDPVNDSVVVNISHDGIHHVVQLSNRSELPKLVTSPDFNATGRMRYWNTMSGDGFSPKADGLYADMNSTGNVSHGDLRIGHWSKTLEAGNVSSGDPDIGAQLAEFNSGDNVYFTDSDGDYSYQAFEGSGSGKKEDRNAIVRSSDDKLNSTDSIIRTGLANVSKFGSEYRFVDSEGTEKYEYGDAIIKDGGSDPDILENEDEVVVAGNASLDNFSDSTVYVETGKEKGFEKGSNESIIRDMDQDGVLERGSLSSGENRVIVPGKANLRNFSQPPQTEGESGLIYVDRNGTNEYNYGEDILNVTLLRNGTKFGYISNETIYNFAETTRHSGRSVYQRGDAIINDTDDNKVYEDVFTGIGVENVYEANSFFKENLTESELQEGEIDVYRVRKDEDEKVGTLSSIGSLKWDGSLNENITEDTTFYLALDVVSSGLEDLVYGIKFETYSITTEGNSLTLSDCSESAFSCTQRILDNHAPELNSSRTGFSKSSNSSQRDKIFVEVLEVGAGLSNTFNYEDFNITPSHYEVTKASIVEGTDNIRLTLNDTLGTNETPEVSLANPDSIKETEGAIKDDANNFRGNDSVEAQDGLRPLIEDISYLDEDVDGTLDMLEVVFSERVNYTSFDSSGWEVESRGVPCLQPLAPGNEASFCSTEAGKIDITSKGDLSLYTESLGLGSMAYVENSSMYEIGGELYNVTSSNTGYTSDGGFVVHEYGNSVSSTDGVWNPDSRDQDVLVYSMNGTELTPGDVLIYDENSSNDNVSISAGEEFTRQDIRDTMEPEDSYRVDAWTGFTGPGPFDPADNNVSVNVSYNSSDYSDPNSTLVSLAPRESVPGLGASKTFNEAGNVKFWNTSRSSTDPVADGLFVDVNMTGNISNGDVRLGKWTLQDEKQLYTHEITSEVDSQTAGSSLNNTLLNLSSGNYSSVTVEDIRSAEIQNETRELNITGNVTSLALSDNGATLNISFNTSKYDVNLSDSDEVSVSYYSESDITFNHLDTVELNSMSAGGVYDGIDPLDQMNTSVVEINATALPDVTGTSGNEPVMNFTVLENLVTDQSGNTLTNTSESVTLTDRAAPAVTSASTQDADNDAWIDRLELEFSENLDNASSSYGSAFNTSNGTIDAVWNRNTGDYLLTLNVSEVGGTAFTPNLTVYTDSVYDSSGNALDDNQSFEQIADGANPLLMNAEIDPALSNSDFTFVDMEFSENVSGSIEADEQMYLDSQEVSFNYTGSSGNLSVNYTQGVLQTGDSPNISSVTGLADDSGNSLEKLHESNVTVNTFRRQMVEGWNFVSFPIADQSTPDIKQVLDTSDVEIMWTKENGSWRSYDPEAPPEVNDLKKLRGGRGYILKASENFTLAPNVNNKWVSDDDKSIDQANTSLKDGSFNLLGQFQEYYQEADTGAAFGSISDGDVGRVYEQKEPGTLELTKIKATDVNDTSERMIPGHAYQVWIKQGDAWTWAEAKR